MTTVQFEISDQSAAALKAKAMKRGVSAEQYLRQIVDRDLDEEPANSFSSCSVAASHFRSHQ